MRITRSIVVMAVLAAGCGPSLERADILPQRGFVLIDIDTAAPQGASSQLPAGAHSFDLSTTFAFDNACSIAATGITVKTRVDAAQAVGFNLGPWKESEGGFAFACADGNDCPRGTFHLHWVADGKRYDAAPARKEDGLPAGTACTVTTLGAALDPEQVVVQGTCENLLGSVAIDQGKPPVFGPVRLQFRALCRVPSR